MKGKKNATQTLNSYTRLLNAGIIKKDIYDSRVGKLNQSNTHVNHNNKPAAGPHPSHNVKTSSHHAAAPAKNVGPAQVLALKSKPPPSQPVTEKGGRSIHAAAPTTAYPSRGTPGSSLC